MSENSAVLSVLESFRRAATRVPAYRALLKEAKIEPGVIKNLNDFGRLPVLEKKNTFQRFEIQDLCLDGELGDLGAVLTSSGHSGIFAFGLTAAQDLPATVQWIDDSLDALFSVKKHKTLLINCLPMGVKVPTQACTLAETSVRPDMAVGLVKAFGSHFAQIILVGEAAFIKHLLELGRKVLEWNRHRVHVIVGEEPLAENARKYLESLLGEDVRQPQRGMIVSSMGVAEVGLNLFSEAPPAGLLTTLRRTLHENTALRHQIFGPAADWVPSLFVYDLKRIYVEFDSAGRLLLTTLDPTVRAPLIRYATGDRGGIFRLPLESRAVVEAAGIDIGLLDMLPIVAIDGRGEHALAGKAAIYPEAVKEGIYLDPALAKVTTANFRLVSGKEKARVRVQLSPGIKPSGEFAAGFETAIRRYVSAPFEVVCEAYESFGSGMLLDYERKFQYLGA